MTISRDLAPQLLQAAETSPSITLTGPRQSGKTTLARTLFPRHRYISLEAPDARSFAAEDPRGFLAEFPDGAIIDEVQRAPDLPAYLQGSIDDDPRPRPMALDRLAKPRPDGLCQSVARRTNFGAPSPSARPPRGRPICPASADAGSGRARRRVIPESSTGGWTRQSGSAHMWLPTWNATCELSARWAISQCSSDSSSSVRDEPDS